MGTAQGKTESMMQANTLKTLALLLTAGLSLPLQAQIKSNPLPGEDTIPVKPVRDEQAVELDAVEITGTRIKQVDVEGPLPITVINRAAIDNSGQLTVTDFLRGMDFNSFGSFNASSGSSGGSQGGAQISLRGLGAERTLILVDGRRLPASPAFAGAAANLNVVPLALVERVEVLREGASAIYGSDAIGGVINIITKKGFEGMQVSSQVDRPTGDGGDGATAALVWGASTDRSSLYFSLDHAQKDIIYMRDRDYTRNLNSAIGNPGTVVFAQNPDTAAEVEAEEGAFANCPAEFDTDPNFPNSRNRGFCRYRFAADAGQTAAVSRDTLSIGGDYKLAGSMQAFARMTSTRAESFGRFAAAPVTNGLLIGPDNANNPSIGNPDCNADATQGCELTIFFRPTDNGTRDNTVVDTVNQFLGGVKGDMDILGYSNWEVGFSHNRYVQREIGTGYGLVRELQLAVDNGEYNPFNTTDPNNSGRSFAHTITSDNAFISQGLDGQISFGNVAEGWLDISVPVVIGAEYRSEDFRTISDAQSAQSIAFDSAGNIANFVESNVFGSAGGSAEGSRDYYGIYSETALDFFDRMLNVGLAVRYDSYSIGGSRTSPKLSFGYRPNDSILVRTSISKGFRAPDLESLYGSPAQSFEDAVDRVGCLADPANAEACDVNQRKTAFDSNPTLKPEKSDNLSLGLVYDVLQDLSFSLDLYRIELQDAITSLTVQAVLDNELRCQQQARRCDPFAEGTVVREPDGDINFVYSPATNAARVETNGLDLGANYGLDTPWGRFSSDLSISYVASFKQQDSAQGELIEQVDTVGVPQFRSTLGVDWRMEAFNAAVVTKHTAQTRDCAPLDVQTGDPACAEHVSSFTTWDTQFGWDAPWGGEVVVGVRNLFDKQPPISDFLRGATDSGVDFTLYEIDGRVPFVRYTQTF